MANSWDAAANIYEGIWKDWSRGQTWGLTWTLCPTHAIILTNAMAVFVTVTGIRIWTIVRYILYQFSASTHPDMTPHLRKKQVILRNAGSDLTTAWLMLNLACSSRRQSTGKRSLSSYGIGLFAISYAVLFWTAGVFSNKAISASSADGTSEVLSRSKHCGIWNQTYLQIVDDPDFSDQIEYDLFVQRKAKVEHDMQLSLEYAQACYLFQSSTKYMSSTCNTMKSPGLNWTVRYGSCPFEPQMCHQGSKVIVLDTGKIDSHKDLGINANPEDRLKYQRLTTCAALDDRGYVKGWNGTIADISASRPPPETAHAYYGPSLYKGTNWTYSYSNFASFYDEFSSQVTLPYQLDPELAYALADPQWSVSDFDPVQEIAQTSADLVLFFLSFTGTYAGSIDDPWFSAHREEQFPSVPPLLQSRFSRDLAISTLGCTVQHQFCTTNKICTGFGGFDQVQNNPLFNTALTTHQNVTFNRMLLAVGCLRIEIRG